jgi:N-terminal domain of CBF1 interacting co-repressor CIR
MPLHLLGKKSWHVYNQDNIDRVRRDEAAAKAREEEDERRMQEADAERRIQLLREQRIAPASNAQDDYTTGRERKRRRLAGEDDTQRDIRLASRDASAMALQTSESQAMVRTSSDAPLMGKDGHISLFPQEGSRFQVQKNPEAEAEAAKKKREYEDQFTMRFSNAAGFKQGIEKPWYSSLKPSHEDTADPVGKDVWGNDDKGRKDRERRRMEDEDPLMAMRKGVSGLREVENDRRKWKEEREKDLKEMNRETSRRRRRDSYELEAFSLDPQRGSNPAKSANRGSTIPASRHRHRHNRSKSRSRSRSRERPRSHRSHSHRHRDHRSRHESHSDRHKRGPTPADDSLTRLRQERDEREKKEKLKAAALLAKEQEGDKPAWVKGAGRYSKQFADQQ